MFTKSDERHPKKANTPWLQFGIKSLIALTLLVAVYCAGWIAGQRHVAEARREAMQQAERASAAMEHARRSAEIAAEIARLQALKCRLSSAGSQVQALKAPSQASQPTASSPVKKASHTEECPETSP